MQEFLESVYDSIEKQEIKMKGQASLAKKDAPDANIVCPQAYLAVKYVTT